MLPHQRLWFTFQTTAGKNVTQETIGTFDTLSTALSASMVPGEEAQTLTAGPVTLACSRVKHGDSGGVKPEPHKVGDSVVTIPQNLTVFGNKTLDVQVCYVVLVCYVVFV